MLASSLTLVMLTLTSILKLFSKKARFGRFIERLVVIIDYNSGAGT